MYVCARVCVSLQVTAWRYITERVFQLMTEKTTRMREETVPLRFMLPGGTRLVTTLTLTASTMGVKTESGGITRTMIGEASHSLR